MTVIAVQWIGAFVIAAAACWFDVRTRRIPNRLTFPAAALGVAVATIVHGADGSVASAAGVLLGLGIFFPLFLLKGLGAGDVKLMAALGAWVGASVIYGVAFYTCLTGGVLALVLVVRHRYGRQMARNFWLLLTHWRVVGIGPVDSLTLETSAGPKLPYALPIAAGLALACWRW